MENDIVYYGSLQPQNGKYKYFGPGIGKSCSVTYVPVAPGEKLPTKLTVAEHAKLLKRPGVYYYPLGGLHV